MIRRALTDAERTSWLRLTRTDNVGPVTFFELIRRFNSDFDAIFSTLPELATRRKSSRKFIIPSQTEVEDELAKADRLKIRMLAACEPDYPIPLAALSPPPPIICIRGRTDALLKPAIAMVGARNASAAGRKLARDISGALSASGYTIVSGMARGIDGEAHAAAIKSGLTIAVLAGGVDAIYPPEHKQLYDAIQEHGAILSETPIGYVAKARDFPKRNRLITGLSLGVVVVEAAQRSGSLISARTALEQGREVMAVPGSPLDARARGTNGLLKQGAWLVENAQDVIEALEGSDTPHVSEPDTDSYSPPVALSLSSTTFDAIRTALSPTPIALDELATSVGVSVRELTAALTEMELSGEAQSHPGGLFSLHFEDT